MRCARFLRRSAECTLRRFACFAHAQFKLWQGLINDRRHLFLLFVIAQFSYKLLV